MDIQNLETDWTSSLHFFDSTHQNFLDAVSKEGEIKVFYRLAGFTLCLKFAGSAMLDALTPALEHLKVDALTECDLTICLWDSSSTHNQPVTLPWPSYLQDIRGEVSGYNNHRIYTVVDIHTKVLHVFDKERNLALYWIQDRRELPWWIGGSPLQLILHWWMRSRGYQLTHAAAVGFPQGGVLLAGNSGAGKSTTTLACMSAGMQYLSEDYCFVGDLPEIWAYSVYNSAKIAEKTLRWFPELGKHVKNSQRAKEDKAFLFHHQFQPAKILLRCPLRAVIALKIEQTKDSSLELIDSRTALTALAFSTMWQLTHTGSTVFKHLKRVVEALPCYQLHLGSDLLQAPKLIGELL